MSQKGMSQMGKAGNVTISTAGNIVNEYTYLTADAPAGATTLSVNNSVLNSNGRFSMPLEKGDLVYIIQMKGATLDGVPDNNSYGAITSYNNCGNNEFAQVLDIPDANTIIIDCGLKYDYTDSGHVQVVRVPRYESLTVTSSGVMTGEAWNGQTGGILAVEVEGNTTINAGGSMDMSGLGFRGGQLDSQTKWGNPIMRSTDPEEGGEKGEGIGGYQQDYDNWYNGRYGRGAPGNGGGGGNAHNCGGGGGANGGWAPGWYGLGVADSTPPGWAAAWELEYPGMSGVNSPGGGRGGYAWSNSNQDATILGPDKPAWSGDSRKPYGGLGGRPVDYIDDLVFFGGGGGAGDNNDGDGGTGGRGGGLVYIMCYGNVSGAGEVISNGENGGNACCADNFQTHGNDGAGGGGAGGTIFITVVGSGTLTGISATANGGNGGSQYNKPTNGTVTEADGTGGGGGGGHIALSSQTITQTVLGGAYGTTNSSSLTEFTCNGATSGNVGNTGIWTSWHSITARDTVVCPGGTVDLSALITGAPPSGTTVVWWDSPAGGSMIFTGSPFTFGPISNDTIIYVGTCPGTFRIPVMITVGNPSAFDAGNDVSICSGGSVQLNATGGTNYLWSPGGTLSNPGVANPVATPVSTMTYYVTITDVGGCSGVDSVTVSVGSNLSVTVTPDTSICEGDSIQLQVSGGGNKFTWTPSATLINPGSANPIAFPVATTKYYVVVEDTLGGCNSNDSVLVNVNAIPVADAGIPDSVCLGDSLQLMASGGGTYLWTPSGSLDDPNISDPKASPLTTTVYHLTVSSGGCSSEDSVQVTVNPVPVAGAGGDVTICMGSSTTLNGSGGGSYQWTPATGLNDPSVGTPVASPNVTTAYELLVTNGFGCTDKDTVVVTIGSSLSVATSGDTSICPGDTVQLSALGGNSYQWTPASTLSNDTIPDPVASPVATTTYVVQVSDTTGCTGIDSIQVNVYAPPNADAGSDVLICEGDSVQLAASGGTNYVWSPVGTLSNPGIVNPKAGPSANTTYYVTVTDVNGCSASDSVAVGISPPPVVNFSNTGACLGDSIFFTDISASTGGPITVWTWSFGDGVTVTGTNNPGHLYGGNGSFLTKLIVSDSLGCTDSITKPVTVSSRPNVNFRDTASGCAPIVVFFDNLSNGGTIYNWDLGDGSTSDQFAPTHAYITPGSYNVKLIVTNGTSGCSDSLTFNNMITVYGAPTAGFTANSTNTTLDDPQVEFTNSSTGGNDLYWFFGDGATSNAINPTHVYSDTGCFSVVLVVKSTQGCTDTTLQQVCVIDDLTLDIPNMITPNNDGANDTWIITNIEKYPEHVISLYNRNGNLLQTFTDYNQLFDGTINGDPLPAAPYYYTLDLGDGNEMIKGILTIIR
ncbi:MAG: T9SS type B sorting domain-containing protein [Flavobacteriales bacterium]|nr:T9SS type B sorting domain-containing protein [Flavobacteriales bacterium]